MKITFTIYNHDESDCYRIILNENDKIIIKSSRGAMFVPEKDLYKVLNEAFEHKMIDME